MKFSAKCVLTANDKSIEKYLCLANCLGMEGSDWTYHWADGGRVVFTFISDELKQSFYASHFLLRD